MDTNVFRYVLEVDKCKNITLAAKHLFISQPALTKQLSKLEKELGFQLFDRAHTPITTTPQGELFLDFARRYQELEQDFQNDIALSRHTPAVPVRIATTHRGGGYAGIHTAAFMAAYPNICLEYLDTSARKCEELLEEEQVDLAIYTDPILSSKLEYMPLEEDPLVFVIPQSSPLLAGLDLSGNSLEHPCGDRVPALPRPLAAVHSCHPRAGAVLRGECFLQKISCHSTGPSPGGIRRYPLLGRAERLRHRIVPAHHGHPALSWQQPTAALWHPER